jgi:FkbM family methyltransferase
MKINSMWLQILQLLRPKWGRMAVRDRFLDMKKMITTDSPIIVDGGAHTGSVIDLFLKQYASPIIYAFEPVPELGFQLEKKYSSFANVKVYQKAIGEKSGNIEFNVLNNLVSSSILKPSEVKKHYHGEKINIKEVVNVSIIRLDEALKEVKEIDILKLDLQGYELEALVGCGDKLSDVKVITTEVEFISLYENQPLFSDIDIFLRRHEFQLFNLYELWTQQDGQLTAGDAVYINNRFFHK